MSRLAFTTLALAACVFLAACSSSEGASPSRSAMRAAEVRSSAPVPSPTATPTLAAAVTPPPPSPTPAPTPVPEPTVSPTPLPILHPPPYTIAIEAGHGGPYYSGASARDRDGNQWVEKDVVLDIAERVYARLAADEQGRYIPVMIRSGDTTLTAFDGNYYRPSLIAEAQARVDVVNSVHADVYLAIHLNGWYDPGQAGTETYYNPDRSFGYQSYGLAWYVQDALVRKMRQAGYEVNDRGLRNDSDVNGDPNNQHSFALGTNANFNPSLMPGVISESLFLTSASDLEFIRTEDGLDVIADAYKVALDSYFAWLVPPS